jgi:hypothetical protein
MKQKFEKIGEWVKISGESPDIELWGVLFPSGRVGIFLTADSPGWNGFEWEQNLCGIAPDSPDWEPLPKRGFLDIENISDLLPPTQEERKFYQGLMRK